MSELKEENTGNNTAAIGKKALERLQSPDDLDNYLRMTTSGIWVTIIACIAILLGIGAWAFFGSVADRITLQGFVGIVGQEDPGLVALHAEQRRRDPCRRMGFRGEQICRGGHNGSSDPSDGR